MSAVIRLVTRPLCAFLDWRYKAWLKREGLWDE